MATSLIQPGSSINTDSLVGDANAMTAKILKPLDQVLRCHICFDYFSNCMMTKCSHNYCSVCIRRYMAYKSQCPTCFQVATEPELQNNRLIDEVLRVYKKIRESLKIPFDSVEKLCSDLPTTSKEDTATNSKKPSKMDTSVCTSSSQPNIEAAVEISTINEDTVSCPVCYITVPSSRINVHLDSCLKQSEERSERKTLPKVVYHLLKDNQIKKMLKDYGLNTSGDRQALIRRHKNFLILYNANCDSLNPKPVSELVVEIEYQELEERLNTSQRIASINKRSDPYVIEKENETYAKEHQSQFNSLIEDLQQRELSRREIKFEFGASQEDSVSSNITDESGNKIGETVLRIDNPSDIETVAIKTEITNSPPSSPYCDVTVKEEDSSRESISSVDKKLHADTVYSTPCLSFRIKKKVPIVMKEVSPSLLDNKMSDEDVPANSPSSLDDFEISKLHTRGSSHAKKNVRKLSTGDGKGRQRKK